MNKLYKLLLSIVLISSTLYSNTQTETLEVNEQSKTWSTVNWVAQPAKKIGKSTYHSARWVLECIVNMSSSAYSSMQSLITAKSDWYIAHIDEDSTIIWEKIDDINAFKNISDSLNIAILVHGLNSDHTYMENIARTIHDNNENNQDGYTHDLVIAYDYNTIPALNRIGYWFKYDANIMFPEANQVDIFCHSMGGLVARHLTESEDLNIPVYNLVTLGTPHNGVPIRLIQNIKWYGKYIKPIVHSIICRASMFAPGDLLADDEEDKWSSSILQMLNGKDSPNKHIRYHTVAGTKSDFLGKLGEIAKEYCNSFMKADCDGIVPSSSAHSPILEKQSYAWGQDDSLKITLPLNHEELRGGENGSNEQNLVSTALLFFINHKEWKANKNTLCDNPTLLQS